MKKCMLYTLFLVSLSLSSFSETKLSVAAQNGKADKVLLVGKTSSQQLVITSQNGSSLNDVTHKVKYSISPAGLVDVSTHGLVKPLENGSGKITVSFNGSKSVSIPFEVKDISKEMAVDFSNDVIPMLTRSGCNSGGCHGKAGGRNGFRLSLLGYEPLEDYRYIVQENRGRRVSPAAPENSLLIQKATGEIPHEGGVRWEVGSEPYEVVRKWIAQGMKYDPEKSKKVEKITLYPTGRTYKPNSSQQIVVTAVYADGSTQDVTHKAQFEVNQEDMAEVDESGFVHFKDLWGSTSVIVRFKEHVATFFGNVTLGEIVKAPKQKNFIDKHTFKKLELLGLPPSSPCDDSTFLRRVTLDIAGRIPTMEEAKEFLADNSPDKRAKAIDRLLDEPGYAHHFANKWTVLLRNKRSRYDGARVTFAFRDWIYNAMKQNVPYDQFVKKIITASGESNINPAVLWYRGFKNDKDFVVEPKEKSEDFAQLFLGVRISCAQCHHHPFDQWSRKDYSGLTAFFSGLKIKPGATKDELVMIREKKENKFNDEGPKPLGGDEVKMSKYQDPRFALADWMTKKKNPYFAKALVNRYWKQFFGRGLVDPIDDMRKTNPPSHPELLDELAQYFIDNNFDLKALVRLICNSQTYQLCSDPNENNVGDQQNYSRYTPRRLTAEVFLDSINDVAGMKERFNNQEAGATRVLHLPDDYYNGRVPFLQTFGRPNMDSASDSSRKTEATVSQSLALINSNDIQKRISYSGGTVNAMSKSKTELSTQVKELFLHVYSRYPSDKEHKFAAGYIQSKIDAAGKNKGQQIKNKKEAIEDILWALINTKEFMFNH